jgi:excisionase family DNA binding protein
VPTTLDARKVVVGPAERRQAQELLAHAALGSTWTVSDGAEAPVPAPTELSRLLSVIVDTVARGGVVTVGAMPEILTTTAAAEVLGVSRPTLMKLVAAGEIPAHKVGSHTRLRTADVLEFRRARLERQRAAVVELLEVELGD